MGTKHFVCELRHATDLSKNTRSRFRIRDIRIQNNHFWSWRSNITKRIRDIFWGQSKNTYLCGLKLFFWVVKKVCVRGTAGAYPGLRSIKRLGVLLLPPGWDASPSQGYPRAVNSPVPMPKNTTQRPTQGSNPDRSTRSRVRWPLGHRASYKVLTSAFLPSGLAGDGGVMDGLRTELSAIVERSRIGDRKQQELEQIITRLEDELSRHSGQTIQLEERLADKMAQIASLESKLGQRNLKVVDLQNELEEKISENGVLQREVPYWYLICRSLILRFSRFSLKNREIQDPRNVFFNVFWHIFNVFNVLFAQIAKMKPREIISRQNREIPTSRNRLPNISEKMKSY